MNLDSLYVLKKEDITEEDPLSDTKDLMELDPLAVVRTSVKEERIEDDEKISVKEELIDEDGYLNTRLIL